MDRLVAAGKVGGLFGVKGELTLTLYDAFPREPNIEEPVFVKIDSHTVPLFFRSFKRRGQRGATVVFEDIDTEVRAAELVGLEFSLRGRGGSGESADDELYLEDLIGWEAEFLMMQNSGNEEAFKSLSATGSGAVAMSRALEENASASLSATGERELSTKPITKENASNSLSATGGKESDRRDDKEEDASDGLPMTGRKKTGHKNHFGAEGGIDRRSGRITDFIDSEFNPLFEIEIDGETELIPAVDDFIVEFDERCRKVVFSLPEGLIGLNK